MKRYVVELTQREADAIVKVSGELCDGLGPPKKETALADFSAAGVAVDEAMANQDRTWESCGECGGSGWVEGA